MLAWALLWIMEVVHMKNVQYNDIFINNIMLHWESDVRLKIGMCNGGVTHKGENVQSLWHAESEETKGKLKEKFWVAPKLLYVYNRRHQHLDVPYTKEVDAPSPLDMS